MYSNAYKITGKYIVFLNSIFNSLPRADSDFKGNQITAWLKNCNHKLNECTKYPSIIAPFLPRNAFYKRQYVLRLPLHELLRNQATAQTIVKFSSVAAVELEFISII